MLNKMMTELCVTCLFTIFVMVIKLCVDNNILFTLFIDEEYYYIFLHLCAPLLINMYSNHTNKICWIIDIIYITYLYNLTKQLLLKLIIY